MLWLPVNSELEISSCSGNMSTLMALDNLRGADSSLWTGLSRQTDTGEPAKNRYYCILAKTVSRHTDIQDFKSKGRKNISKDQLIIYIRKQQATVYTIKMLLASVKSH